jgi:hypothetical protein
MSTPATSLIKAIVLVSLCAAAALLLAGCGGGSDMTEEPPPQAEERPAPSNPCSARPELCR